MSFLDFFVLEEAWSKRLRDFVKRVQVANAKTATRSEEVDKRLEDIEADMGFLALLQIGTLKLLTDKGLLKDGELVPRLAAVDLLDGVEDGKLNVSAVRELIGLPRALPRKKEQPATHAPARPAKGKGKGKKPAMAASGKSKARRKK
jgi:hypothetical protein